MAVQQPLDQVDDAAAAAPPQAAADRFGLWAEYAVHSQAAVVEVVEQRLEPLDRRLAGDGAVDAVNRHAQPALECLDVIRLAGRCRGGAIGGVPVGDVRSVVDARDSAAAGVLPGAVVPANAGGIAAVLGHPQVISAQRVQIQLIAHPVLVGVDAGGIAGCTDGLQPGHSTAAAGSLVQVIRPACPLAAGILQIQVDGIGQLVAGQQLDAVGSLLPGLRLGDRLGIPVDAHGDIVALSPVYIGRPLGVGDQLAAGVAPVAQPDDDAVAVSLDLAPVDGAVVLGDVDDLFTHYGRPQTALPAYPASDQDKFYTRSPGYC